MSEASERSAGTDEVPPRGDRRRVRQAPGRASYARETLHAALVRGARP